MDESAWTPIKYVSSVWDAEEERWGSDAELAEVPFTTFSPTPLIAPEYWRPAPTQSVEDFASPGRDDRGVTGVPPAAVEFGVKKNNDIVEGPDGLVYMARLPLASAPLNYLATLIRGYLKKIGSRWRALPAGKISGIVLAVLRCDQRPGDLAGGNGVHRTTVSRWVREVVGLLAARALRLDRSLKKIARKGGGVVLLDGSLIRTGIANRKNYSGKHKCHGLLVIALTDDRGRLVWVSAVRPGRTSEITACRHDKLTAKLRAAGLGAIADFGFVGLDDSGPDADPAVITGYKAARNRPLTRSQRLSNKALAAVRAPVEHGFAHLKNWRVLGKVRTDPKWATALVRALLVLTNREVAR
ncbi:transposase family protein [Streptomyces sp. NPDC051098]|uniref:transposase family protein n=1 Tax=Streptomyces sp. NPDC051098 TaxID=3155411 RepID=UPI003446D13D